MSSGSRRGTSPVDTSATGGDLSTVFLSKSKGARCEVLLSSTEVTPNLLLTNVPTFLSVPELLQRMGRVEHLVHTVRVVTTTQPDSYGMVVVAVDAPGAAAIRDELNLKPLSALSKEALVLQYIQEMRSASDDLSNQEIDLLLSEGKKTAAATSPAQLEGSPRHRQQPPPPVASAGGRNTSDSISFAVQRQEKCPICLERFGWDPLLHTQCGHSFHLACFRRVEDDSCPMCRYAPSAENPAAVCTACESTLDLWMCLVCGEVHCGRYSSGHAAQHYLQHGHRVARQVGGFRMWDFDSDDYVHRLVALDEGGKVTPVKTAQGTTPWWALDEDEEEELEKAKLESKAQFIADFYSQMLQHQLQQQEDHYEQLLMTTTKESRLTEFVVEEQRSRRALASECVRQYDAMYAEMKEFIVHDTRTTHKLLKALRKEVDCLEATNESLQTGLAKGRALLQVTQDAEKEKKQLQPLRDQIEQLEKELEQVYSQF